MHRLGHTLLITLLLLSLSGCSLFINSASSNFGNNLTQAITSQQDPDTVKQAIPPYLLLLDTMLVDQEDNSKLLLSSAALNNTYGSLFVENTERRQQFANKAFDYAKRALCYRDDSLCQIQTIPFDTFTKHISGITKEDIPDYFTLASSWAFWIQTHNNDWNAIAQVARIEIIMQQIVNTDETFRNGSAHLYLGVLNTLIPPALGGKPDIGKQHFERAIDLTSGKNLYASVLYAEKYARLVFDRSLHDSLLKQVLQDNNHYPKFELINSLAKRRARKLLDSANDYF